MAEDRMPWLGALLVDTDAAGDRRYTDEEAEDFLAGLLLSQGVPDPATLPPAMLDLLDRFAARAKIPPDADREVADRRVAEHFARHPVPEDLRRAFGRRYREMLTDLDPSALADAAARIGALPRAASTAEPTGARGALAFFRAHRDLDD